jgi:hypothetical protein
MILEENHYAIKIKFNGTPEAKRQAGAFIETFSCFSFIENCLFYLRGGFLEQLLDAQSGAQGKFIIFLIL